MTYARTPPGLACMAWPGGVFSFVREESGAGRAKESKGERVAGEARDLVERDPVVQEVEFCWDEHPGSAIGRLSVHADRRFEARVGRTVPIKIRISVLVAQLQLRRVVLIEKQTLRPELHNQQVGGVWMWTLVSSWDRSAVSSEWDRRNRPGNHHQEPREWRL